MKKYLIKFFLIFLSIINFANADAPLCETINSVTPPNTLETCRVDADALQINLYEVGLCGASNNFNPSVYDSDVLQNQINTSNCTKIWNGGSSGVTQIINSLSVTGVNGGNSVIPASGTYLYGYVKLTNALGLQINKQFSTDVYGSLSGLGRYCWTINSQFVKDKLRDIETTDTTPSGICSNLRPANSDLGFATQKMLSFNDGKADNPDYVDTTIQGAHKLYVYLTPQFNPSVGVAGFHPTEFLAFFTLTNPIIVPADPSNIKLGVLFAMTGSAAVRNNAPIGSSTPILGFHSQPFDIMIQSY